MSDDHAEGHAGALLIALLTLWIMATYALEAF